MALTDKMKELGEGIRKTAKENEIKLEKQKKHIIDIQNDLYSTIIANRVLIGRMFLNNITDSRILTFTEEFYDNVYRFYKDNLKKPIYFSGRIPSKIIDKFKSIYEFDTNEEMLLCYYGGSKDNFILTTRRLYFNIKHFEECLIYSLSVDLDKISSLYVDSNTNEFKINNVTVFKVDSDKVSILNKYFLRMQNNNLEFTQNDISCEIESVIDKKDIEKIKEMFDDDEKFEYLARSHTRPRDIVICTSKRLIMQSAKSVGFATINEIKYKDIDFIDIEDDKDITVVLNIFRGVSIEVIFQGTKLIIKDINIEDAKRIVQIVNKSRERVNLQCKGIISNSDDVFVKIEKLAKLKEIGAITEEELNEKKKELLKRI